MSLDDNVASRHIVTMRLLEWRQAEGLKQEEIASAIDVTVSQYSKIERGETWTSPKTASLILALTKKEVTPNDLHDTWREYQGRRAA